MPLCTSCFVRYTRLGLRRAAQTAWKRIGWAIRYLIWRRDVAVSSMKGYSSEGSHLSVSTTCNRNKKRVHTCVHPQTTDNRHPSIQTSIRSDILHRSDWSVRIQSNPGLQQHPMQPTCPARRRALPFRSASILPLPLSKTACRSSIASIRRSQIQPQPNDTCLHATRDQEIGCRCATLAAMQTGEDRTERPLLVLPIA